MRTSSSSPLIRTDASRRDAIAAAVPLTASVTAPSWSAAGNMRLRLRIED
jgi:hypothetical protein